MTDRYARYTRLKFDRPHPKVLRVTMDNGRMNTADAAMHAELGEIWRDIDADPSVNAAIITGAGRMFSAGGDFAMIREQISDFDVRARGGAAEAFEGAAPKRTVVLEFPNADAARRWYHSPEYTAARKLRAGCATGRLVVVEGL